MTLRARYPAVLGACLLAAHAACAAAPKSSSDQQFGVIGHSFSNRGGERQLEKSLAKTRDAGLAFVVATGIKSLAEPCSDELYERRRNMFDGGRTPVVVVPAASDWAECKNAAGRLVNIERLNRLRELLYAEPGAPSDNALALARQSANAKFRSYAENAYWSAGNVLYATVNLPSNNNHYRPEAGRNSEFEDRAVANRFWISRLFALAKRKKLAALVLFSEGDARVLSGEPGLLARLGRNSSTQDGFALPRRQIVALAAQFPGKVLLIDTAPVANGSEPVIAWRDNLGHVSIGARAVHVHVTPKAETLFRIEQP
ncbi:MAG: hypothetical protein V4631_15730 [Pseudomonadota bacterium]